MSADPRPCLLDGDTLACSGPGVAWGLCHRHYTAWRAEKFTVDFGDGAGSVAYAQVRGTTRRSRAALPGRGREAAEEDLAARVRRPPRGARPTWPEPDPASVGTEPPAPPEPPEDETTGAPTPETPLRAEGPRGTKVTVTLTVGGATFEVVHQLAEVTLAPGLPVSAVVDWEGSAVVLLPPEGSR